MVVIPAIDIRGGQVVRLTQGDFSQESRYGLDPVATAQGFADAGATRLHLVDLDGARAGTPQNAFVIEAVLEAVGGKMQVEIGGGVRSFEDIGHYLAKGASWVVLGTRAIEDPHFLEQAARLFAGNILLALDVRHGRLAASGWEQESRLEPLPFARAAQGHDIAGFIYTDISKDGTLSGVDARSIAEFAGALKKPLLASGGVHTLDDIESLANTGSIAGVIVGKALYSGTLNLREALTLCQQKESRAWP